MLKFSLSSAVPSILLLGAGGLLALAAGLGGAATLLRPAGQAAAIPPIDGAAPKAVETATFALG